MRLLFATLLLAAAIATAQPQGAAVPLSGSGCRFPDVAWSATSDRFLAVWADYSLSPARICGRLVSADGASLSNLTCYSDALANGLYPAVAWNEVTDEFLLTWDDSARPGGGERIWGQRINAADGAALGANFQIAATPSSIRSGVTSTGAAGFAVTWYAQSGGNLEAFVTFVSPGGVVGAEVNASEDAIFSGYPAITSLGDRVLVTWDRDDAAIGARLFSASAQAVVGGPFVVSAVGGRDRSSSAADGALGVFWVNFNDASVAGQGYNQQAQRVSSTGVLLGGAIDVAATAAFEGETLVGTDIVFDTFAGRALTAFQFEGAVTGLAVQELNEAGALEGTSGLISTGADGVMGLAVDQRQHHAVVVWERQASPGAPHVIHLRAVKLRDTRPPPPPTLSPAWIELGDGGVALIITPPAALDVRAVSLSLEAGGQLALLGSSSANPAVLGFERRPGTQRLCATAFDGTNDSTPECVEVTLAEPDAGSSEPDAGDAGQLGTDGGSPDGGSGQLPMASGTCGCSGAPAMLAALLALALAGRSRR